MYETRQLGEARLELLTQIAGHVAFSDFCKPAGTIDFVAVDGFLQGNLVLFRLLYPGYELEARVRDGMVFIRRNDLYQHSSHYLGSDRARVALQWNVDSIACGVVPDGGDMNCHMRAVRTPPTVPPRELVRALRANSLLFNSAYRSADELFVTVLDCLHF